MALIQKLDMDKLYEELCTVKETLKKVIDERAKESTEKASVYEVWHKILSASNTRNLLKIFQYIASIPCSNAAAERIFTLCM